MTETSSIALGVNEEILSQIYQYNRSNVYQNVYKFTTILRVRRYAERRKNQKEYSSIFGWTMHAGVAMVQSTAWCTHVCIVYTFVSLVCSSKWIVYISRMYRCDRFAFVNDIQMAAVDMRNWKCEQLNERMLRTQSDRFLRATAPRGKYDPACRKANHHSLFSRGIVQFI